MADPDEKLAAQEPPKPPVTAAQPPKDPVVDTPETLHDAAISAVEAWKTNPTPETEAAAKTASAKAKDAIKALPKKVAVPEKYDLKLKEGSNISAKHLEKISAFAKAKGLSNEDAQALVDRDQENFSEFTSAQMAEVQKEKDKWLPEAQADTEIGGENFSKNVELAKRVLDKVGSDGLRKFLNDTGFGNHPEVVRVFYRLGKMMTEDQLVISGQPPAAEKKSPEQVMYDHPDSNK